MNHGLLRENEASVLSEELHHISINILENMNEGCLEKRDSKLALEVHHVSIERWNAPGLGNTLEFDSENEEGAERIPKLGLFSLSV